MFKRILKKFIPQRFISVGVNILTYFNVQYLRLIHHPVVIRENTTDIHVFRNMFLYHELKMPVKIRRPQFIIDAGAYVGYSTLFFALKYPTTQIVAIEPEPSNFDMLEKNTATLANISRINAGLWYREGFLNVVDTNREHWGYVTQETSVPRENCIPAITIPTILYKFKINKIDILKLDIEGAEKEVFSDGYESWLKSVKILVIELHDWVKEGCSRTFYQAVNKFSWRKFRQGEKIILVNKSIN